MNVKMFVVLASVMILSSGLIADTFGTGANQFDIDFVTISGSWRYGLDDFRMGVYEITNDQWNKFKTELGVPVTGDPSGAYNSDPYFTSVNVPVNNVSWYEAAQFVNWLNTSTGHHAAYNFTGTQGTSDYTMTAWNSEDRVNLYRHKDAVYYLPSETEWRFAAYRNVHGEFQTYATKSGESLTQGNGTSGTGWNYRGNGATDPIGPWAVGSGSEELNGTFDMMGNVLEWMESNYGYSNDINATRCLRGGAYIYTDIGLTSSYRLGTYPTTELSSAGFRVASKVPEPASLSVLAIGGLVLLRRCRK